MRESAWREVYGRNGASLVEKSALYEIPPHRPEHPLRGTENSRQSARILGLQRSYRLKGFYPSFPSFEPRWFQLLLRLGILIHDEECGPTPRGRLVRFAI